MAQRTLVITAVHKISEGTRKDGKGTWKLQGLTAEDPDGKPVNEKLKSFDDFPLNQPVEVEVEKEESEKYGVSYMVKQPSLTSRVEKLEAQVAELSGGEPTVDKEATQAPEVEGDDIDPADIPF